MWKVCGNIFQLRIIWIFKYSYSNNISREKTHKIFFFPLPETNLCSLTCESLSPSFSASFLRSGLLMYFCIWNLFSSPRRWRSEKTALLIIPRRGLPRAFVAHGKTRPVPEKSPMLPWIAPGNTAPLPGVPGWWLPVPEPATIEEKYIKIISLLRYYFTLYRKKTIYVDVDKEYKNCHHKNCICNRGKIRDMLCTHDKNVIKNYHISRIDIF